MDIDEPELGWQPLAPLRNARNHIGGTAYNGKLYAIGGQHLELEFTENQNNVEVYDVCTNTWTNVAPLPYPLGHISNAVFSVTGRGIFVIGGARNGP